MKKVLGMILAGTVFLGIAFGGPAIMGTKQWFQAGLVVIGGVTLIAALLSFAGWLMWGDDEKTK